MTTDERFDRIERAIATLGVHAANHAPLRGLHVNALQEIVAEINERDRASAAEQRREELQAELDAMETAA